MKKRKGRIAHSSQVNSCTSSNTPVTCQPMVLGMIVFLFALGVALFLSWSPSMTVYKPVPANIINSFNQLVFRGKLQELKILVERNSDLDWAALGKGRRKGLTAIHHALNGRFRSLSSHTGALIGGHEVNQKCGNFHLQWLAYKNTMHSLNCVCVCVCACVCVLHVDMHGC